MTEQRIVDPVTGGEKGQKEERFDLFPFDALEEVARVYGKGAQKYSDDNWLRGYAWRLSAGALLRHVSRFMCGEDRDPETGCLHLAHAAWHCLTLITFNLRGLGTDDRKPPEYQTEDPWDFDFQGFSGIEFDELDNPIPYVPAGRPLQVGDVIKFPLIGWVYTVSRIEGPSVWGYQHGKPSKGEVYITGDGIGDLVYEDGTPIAPLVCDCGAV